MTVTPELHAKILSHYHLDHLRTGTIASKLQIHHGTVERVLRKEGLPPLGPARSSRIDPYRPFISEVLENYPTMPASHIHKRACAAGYVGGAGHFRRFVSLLRKESDGKAWMVAVLQNKIDIGDLRKSTDNVLGLEVLLQHLYEGRLRSRNKAMAMLAHKHELPIELICSFLGMSTSTYAKYKRTFSKGGVRALFSPYVRPNRKSDDESLKREVFKVLHEPPSNYGLNRTTWTMPLLRHVLCDSGNAACPDVIRTITRKAGYRWRKARTVLTSTDPEYSQKLELIHNILGGLKSDEAFFSIDEYGPFAIKMYGGRKLVAPGEQPVVPQWQKSRGSLILTAALELSSNQITHFYSDKKNTAEMIKMMDHLIIKYASKRKIFLSWDAASWHISKTLTQRIKENNDRACLFGGVLLDTAPLPSGAQFLNVIESVFSGMSRAIIHNSNYPSIAVAKVAIDRYIEDRNAHFQEFPQRAGNKVWGREIEPAVFSESSNCKDPRYR